jgi:hypothetical protein
MSFYFLVAHQVNISVKYEKYKNHLNDDYL